MKKEKKKKLRKYKKKKQNKIFECNAKHMANGQMQNVCLTL